MQLSYLADSGIRHRPQHPAAGTWPESASLPARLQNPETAMIDVPLDDRVLTALENNPYVPRRNLRFETSDGRVTLRGVVDSYFQKQMAQEALRHVDGIHLISNELEVCWYCSTAILAVTTGWKPVYGIYRGCRGRAHPNTASCRVR